MKDKKPSKAPFAIEAPPACKDMYTYDGRMTIEDGVTSEYYPIDLNQFLHRGSFLENSDFVQALVVHTGPESKLIMNLGQYRFKRSRFETVLNYILVFNLGLAITFAFCGAVMNGIWTSDHIETHLYIFQQMG